MKIKVKKYYYNLSNEEEAKAYQELKDRMEARGTKLFDCISSGEKSGQIEGEFELEEKFIFNNQCNAGDFRVFDWYGHIYPNRKIKDGHYIESGPGFDYLQNLRRTTKVCGYCGKQYPKATEHQSWCEKCLGSQYLKEDELRLLKLKHIASNGSRETELPPDWLVEKYHNMQREARTARLEAEKSRKLADCQKQIESAKIEYEGFKQIIEAGLSFDNCIYYNHTGRFCFGWRTALTEAEKIEIGDKLKNFTFEYDMK